MRGGYEARWTAHETAVKNKIFETDEVHEIEGRNRRLATPEAEPGAA